MKTYIPHAKTQAQHSIESHLFDVENAPIPSTALNSKQSRLKLSNQNFLKVQDAFLDRVRPIRLGGAFKILEYIVRKSGNLTGSIYRVQATIARDNGYSISQTQKHLYRLEKLGLIEVTPAGYQKSNIYMYNYHLLNDNPATVGKCGTRADSPPAKPDITTITSSDDVLTTLKSKEEISINTNPIKYDFFVEQNEPRVPIPVAEFSARQSTRECVKRKLGHYSYDFVDECEKGFRLEPREQGILRMPDEWNRKFNVYCHKSQWLKDNRPSDKDKKWIPRWIRLTHNAAVNSRPHTEVHADAHEPYVSKEPDAPPISKAIIYGPIQQPDYKGALTPEDHEEMDESANEYYRKNNVRPPKYDS